MRRKREMGWFFSSPPYCHPLCTPASDLPRGFRLWPFCCHPPLVARCEWQEGGPIYRTCVLPRFRVRDLFSAPREISLYPSRPIWASQTPAIHFAVSLWPDRFVLLKKKRVRSEMKTYISRLCLLHTHTFHLCRRARDSICSVNLSHSRSPFFSLPCRFLHHLFWRLGIDDRAPRPELGLWTVARDRRRPHGAGWRAPVPLFRKWSHRISAATHYSPVAERPALSDAFFPCDFLLKAVENKQNTQVGRGG